MCRDQCFERAERSASHHQARLRFEAPASGGNGGRVAVEREQTVAAPKRFEDAGCVTAAAKGCVDVQSRRDGIRGRSQALRRPLRPARVRAQP